MASERCTMCSGPADQRCAGCKLVFYCSRDHQRQHWKQHKPQCTAVKQSYSEELGRYLCASRDLAAGEVVLRESPLVEAPPPCTPAVCLGCYKQLFEHTARECTKCGWPVCGLDCENDPKHQPECRFTVNKRGTKMHIRNFGMPHPSYQCMMVLRCLALRESNPSGWRFLQTLESHADKINGTQRYEQEKFGIAQFIRRVFPKLADEFSEDDILKVCGIVQVNGHEVPLTVPSHVAIYEKASLLAHSCRANCCKSFTSNGTLVIRTAVPVKNGDPLTICYTDPLWDTRRRRRHLYETKYFWCFCERCKDLTEFGTNFSGLACPGDNCQGILLPERLVNSNKLDPANVETDEPWDDNLKDEDGATWLCSLCDVSMFDRSVFHLMGRLHEDLITLHEDPEACRMFLERYGGEEFPLDLSEKPSSRRPILSPMHSYLIDVRLTLAQKYGQDGPQALQSLTDGELTHKSILCKQILQLTEKLVPAENRMRGLLLFELHAVEAETSRRRGLAHGQDPSALRSSLLESKKYLAKAIELLCFEPYCLPEGKILQQARKNMEDLDQMLRVLHQAVGDSPL